MLDSGGPRLRIGLFALERPGCYSRCYSALGGLSVRDST
jgi:hypothetical protein